MKNIKTFVQIGLATLALNGCSESYEGQRGNEYVQYSEKSSLGSSIPAHRIEVTKEDGTELILKNHSFYSSSSKKLQEILIKSPHKRAYRAYNKSNFQKIITGSDSLFQEYVIWGKEGVKQRKLNEDQEISNKKLERKLEKDMKTKEILKLGDDQ